MELVPFNLSLTVTSAIAVFLLGAVAWWHYKWSRSAVLFALMAFTLSLWTAVGWFRELESTALPGQVVVWRYLFYFGVALGPALAYHVASILQRRRFRKVGWMMYAVSAALFVIIDSAFFLRSAFPHRLIGQELLNIGSIAGLAFYIIVFYVISIQLYPLTHAPFTQRLERRREMYGLVLLVVYLAAGAFQFLTVEYIPTDVLMTVFSAAFFAVAAIGFVRVQFLGVAIESLEAFFIVLLSGAMVVILKAGGVFETLVAIFGSLVVALFGVRAVRSLRNEAFRRQELERINIEMKTLDEAKSEFVAMVAHQLRSPLGGIRFASDMLVHGDYGELTQAAKGVVKLMKQTAERLLALAETSLNAARFDVGAFQLNPMPLDVALEIRMLLDEAGLFAKAKGLELESQFEGLPKHLLFDREVLRNVVFNLVDNAIKYTDKGRIRVDAVLRGERLTVSVSDTGAGLSAHDKKNLFHRFYRGHVGQRLHPQGAGLGLYVTKRMVEAAGGEVSVVSEGLGKGSTFSVMFPVSEVDGSQETQVR